MLSVGKTLISLPLEPLAKYPATLSGGKLVPGPTEDLLPRTQSLRSYWSAARQLSEKGKRENPAGEPWDENGVAGRSGKAEIECAPRLLTVPPFLDSQEGARIAESSSY